jgi:hypothetical protein
VAAMEDVLEVYHRPYDPKRPAVNLDEASRQLIGETRVPVPAAPGRPAREDFEYVRNGTANVFMISQPLAGTRHVEVTDRRTALDFANVLRLISDDLYEGAEKVVLVMDNLNTHKLSSLYQAFAPEEARRLWERFEVHHTPKHGSWLNMAEIELSVLSRQCLDQRFEGRDALTKAVNAWLIDRKERGVGVDWQFTTADARIKLKHLYPSIQS